MRGLKDSSNAQWPILANAFAPGTTHYVKDPTQKGGVWKGMHAIVIWVSGSAEVTETREKGDVYFVKRVDKPAADAFVQDGDWLGSGRILRKPVSPETLIAEISGLCLSLALAEGSQFRDVTLRSAAPSGEPL